MKSMIKAQVIKFSLFIVSIFLSQLIFSQNTAFELNRGHQGWLNGYALSPSNKYLVTAGTDHQLIIWDYASGRQIRALNARPGVSSLAISHDDKFLVSLDTAGWLCKWDMGTGKKVLEFLAHGGSIKAIKNKYLTYIDSDDDRGWMSTIRENYIYSNYRNRGYLEFDNERLSISYDNQLIASGGKDGLVNLWNSNTGKLANSYKGHRSRVTLVHLSQDNRIISQDQSDLVFVKELKKGNVLDSFFTNRIYKCDKDTLYFQAPKNSIAKYDTKDIKIIQKLSLLNNFIRPEVVINENLIWARSSYDSIGLIDIKQNKILTKLSMGATLLPIMHDSKGNLIRINEDNKKAICLNYTNGEIEKEFGVYCPTITQLKVSHNGKHLIIVDNETSVTLISLKEANEPLIQYFNIPDPETKHHLEVSPDDSKLICVSALGDVRMYDLSGENKVWKKKVSVEYAITSINLVPEKNAIALIEYRNGVQLLSLSNLSTNDQYLIPQKEQKFKFNLATYSPKHSSILFNDIESYGLGTFVGMNVMNGSESKEISQKLVLPSLENRLISFKLSRDTSHVIFIDKKNTAGIYSTNSHNKTLNITNCQMIDWLGNEEQHVIYNINKQVFVYSLKSQTEVTNYLLPNKPIALAASKNGLLLFTITPEHKIEVRNSFNGMLLYTLTWKLGKNDYLKQTSNGSYQTIKEYLKSVQNVYTESEISWDDFSKNKFYNSSLWSDFSKFASQNLGDSLFKAQLPQPIVKNKLHLSLGHFSSIYHLSFHQNNKLLLSIDKTGKAISWDLAKGTEIMSATNHALEKVTQVESTKSANWIQYTNDHYIYKLNLLSGAITGEQYIPDYNSNNSNSSTYPHEKSYDAISADKSRYAQISSNKEIEIRKTKSNELVCTKMLPGLPTLICLDSMGITAAITINNSIWIWSIDSNSLIKNISNFYSNSDFVQVTTSGHVIYKDENYSQVIDLKTGVIKHKMIPSDDTRNRAKQFNFIFSKYKIIDVINEKQYSYPTSIFSIKYLFSTRLTDKFGIVGQNDYQTFFLWDSNSEKILYEIKYPENIYGIQSDKTDSLAAIITNKNVSIIGLKSGKQKALIPVNFRSGYALNVHFIENSNQIAFPSNEKEISIWELTTPKLIRTIKCNEGVGYILGVSLEMQHIYTFYESIITVYNFSGEIVLSRNFGSHIDAEFFPKQNRIIIATNSKMIYSMNIHNLLIEETLLLGKNNQWIKTNRIGSYEASIKTDALIQGGKNESTIIHKNQNIPVMLNFDAINILPSNTSSHKQLINDPFQYLNLMWSKKLIPNIQVSDTKSHVNANIYESINNTLFIPNSSFIALQHFYGDITILESSTKRLLKTLSSRNNNHVSAIVSENGEFLVSVENNNNIKVWSLKTLELTNSFMLSNTTITAISIDKNTRNIAVGTINGSVSLLNLSTLQPFKELFPFNSKIINLAFSNDSNFLAVANQYSSILIQNLRSANEIPYFYNFGRSFEVIGLEFNHKNFLLCSGKREDYIVDCKDWRTEKIETPKRIQYHSRQFWSEEWNNSVEILRKDHSFFSRKNENHILYPMSKYSKISYAVYDFSLKQLIDSVELKLPESMPKIFGQRYISDLDLHVFNIDSMKIQDISSNNTMMGGFDVIDSKLYYNLYDSKLYAIDLVTTEKIVYDNFKGETIFKLDNKLSYIGYLSRWPTTFGLKVINEKEPTWSFSGDYKYAVSKNGQYYVVSKPDSVFIYSTSSKKVLYRIPKTGYFTNMYVSNTGKYLVLTDYQMITIHNFKDEPKIFKFNNTYVSFVYFSTDDKFVSFRAPSLKVFDLQKFNLITYNPSTSNYTHVAGYQNPRFTILCNENQPWANQLWDIEKNKKLGDFYFWQTQKDEPTWVFITPDGRFDGSPAGLKQLYTVDEQNWKSQDVQLDNNPKYITGLLGKLKLF
jgi:WD40 repeat protein